MKHCAVASVMLLLAVTFCAVTTATEGGQKDANIPKKKIVLWNGKDFSGWKLFVPEESWDVSRTWSVRDGVIRCEGVPAGYMRTEQDYANYLFHLEWRWPGEKGSNSGALVHMSGPDKVWPRSIECQLHSGNAGDLLVIGGTKFKEHNDKSKRVKWSRVVKLKSSSEKPLGEWNVYEIICKDDWIVVLVNGVLQNVATKVSVSSGKICLQSEGGPIEFRNIYIEPVDTE